MEKVQQKSTVVVSAHDKSLGMRYFDIDFCSSIFKCFSDGNPYYL